MVSNEVSLFVMTRFRRIRLLRDWTGPEAARASGLAQATYTSLELGRHRLNVEVLFRLLWGFGAEVSEVWPDQPLEGAASQDAASGLVRTCRLREEREWRRNALREADIADAAAEVFSTTREALGGTARGPGSPWPVLSARPWRWRPRL